MPHSTATCTAGCDIGSTLDGTVTTVESKAARERRVVRVGRVLVHGFYTIVLAVTVATAILVALAVAFGFFIDG